MCILFKFFGYLSSQFPSLFFSFKFNEVFVKAHRYHRHNLKGIIGKYVIP